MSLQGWVVAYPIMQAYDSLTLEDNSEVGEDVLGRCTIVVAASVSVPSRFEPKK